MKLDFNPSKKRPLSFGFFTDTHIHHVNPRSRKDDYQAAIEDKISQVWYHARQRDWQFIIFGGDLFHGTVQPLQMIARVLDLFIGAPCPIYGIVGNHDFRGNIQNFSNSAAGIVYASSLVKRLNSEIIRDSRGEPLIIFKALDYDTKVEAPGVPEEWPEAYYILVAHAFTHFYGKEGALSKGDVKEKGWDVVLAGHDHMTYPIQMGDDGVLYVRPGSLSRGTKAVQDRFRRLYVAEMTYDGDKMGVNLVHIKAKSPEEVYSEERIEREGIERNIKQFVKVLSKREVEEKDKISIVLDSLCKKTPKVKEVVKSYLIEEGVI